MKNIVRLVLLVVASVCHLYAPPKELSSTELEECGLCAAGEITDGESLDQEYERLDREYRELDAHRRDVLHHGPFILPPVISRIVAGGGEKAEQIHALERKLRSYLDKTFTCDLVRENGPDIHRRAESFLFGPDDIIQVLGEDDPAKVIQVLSVYILRGWWHRKNVQMEGEECLIRSELEMIALYPEGDEQQKSACERVLKWVQQPCSPELLEHKKQVIQGAIKTQERNTRMRELSERLDEIRDIRQKKELALFKESLS